MKTCTLAGSILLYVLFASTGALAKAPAAKITIEGGGRTEPIEITEEQCLTLSNPWSGRFIDERRGAVAEAPRGIGPNQISIYVKFSENDVRRAYVLFYHQMRLDSRDTFICQGAGTRGST